MFNQGGIPLSLYLIIVISLLKILRMFLENRKIEGKREY